MHNNQVKRSRVKSFSGIIGSLLFLFVAFFILHNRHFYDDELRNIWLIHHYGYLDIINIVNIYDVHPPLSYILNKVFFNLFGSYELIIVPTIIFLSIALYLFFSYSETYIKDSYGKILLFMFTFLNPNILMWGISLRWYSYWIGLFLFLFIIVFLAPRNPYSIYLGTIIIALMTYLSYLTFIVAPLFTIVWLIKYRFQYIKEILVSLLIYFALVSYQVYNFLIVSIKYSPSQVDSPLKSLFMVLYSMSIGNTVFPLDPIGITFGIALLILSLYLLPKITRLPKDHKRCLFLILLFILSNIVLLSFSGIGGKYRNSLYLNIIFIFALSFLLIFLGKKERIVFLALSAVFITISSYNIIFHQNTAKIAVNLPLEQFESFLVSLKTAPGHPDMYILTYDPTLGFYLCRTNYKTIAFYENPFSQNNSFQAHKGDYVIIAETYNNTINKEKYDDIKKYHHNILDNLDDQQIVRLGYDKYNKFKSTISGDRVPEYMIVVKFGKLKEDLLLHYDENILPQPRQGG